MKNKQYNLADVWTVITGRLEDCGINWPYTCEATRRDPHLRVEFYRNALSLNPDLEPMPFDQAVKHRAYKSESQFWRMLKTLDGQQLSGDFA